MSIPVARRSRLWGDEGITAVIVALFMTLILLFAALAIDGGVAYVARREAQNAADAGAMAGVRALELVKFRSGCSASTPELCDTDRLRTEIMRQARNTGADHTPGGVRCYLLDGNQNRLGDEFCASGSGPSPGFVLAASGVEVRARQTNRTYFASLADVSETQANTLAKAFIFNFAGGTASPFVVCGTRDAMPADYPSPMEWAYDLVASDGAGGYLVKPGVIGKHYQIQGASNPICGAGSKDFKGIGSDQVLMGMPTDAPITGGNANVANVEVAVAGIKACPPGASTFDGCGMLLPIASHSTSKTTMWVVTWMAWQVWGSGSSYTFPGSKSDPVGASCQNPIAPGGGGTKYCAKLLGAVALTGGVGSGPGTAGQPHVLKLVA
jgi:hypothetical protein